MQFKSIISSYIATLVSLYEYSLLYILPYLPALKKDQRALMKDFLFIQNTEIHFNFISSKRIRNKKWLNNFISCGVGFEVLTAVGLLGCRAV
jgi:hypothetical protein